MQEFYTIFSRKKIFPIFFVRGGVANAPYPPSFTPMLLKNVKQLLKYKSTVFYRSQQRAQGPRLHKNFVGLNATLMKRELLYIET